MPTYQILTHSVETKNYGSRLDWNDEMAHPFTYEITADNMVDAINKLESELSVELGRIVSVEETIPNPNYTYGDISMALFGSGLFGDRDDWGDYTDIDLSKMYSNPEYDKKIDDLIIRIGHALGEMIAPDIDVSIHHFNNVYDERSSIVVRVKREGTTLETVTNILFDYLALSGKTGWDAIVYTARLILLAYHEKFRECDMISLKPKDKPVKNIPESNESNYRTESMYIIYKDKNGELHSQPYEDLVSSGTLSEGDSGEDTEIVGWSTDNEDPTIQ